MDGWLAPFGLTWEMFDLLASLHVRGANGPATDRSLRGLHAVIGRHDQSCRPRREARLCGRRPDPDDGRATRIALTKRGRSLTEKAMTEHASRAGAISHRLTAKEQGQLAGLLRKLLRSFEATPEFVLWTKWWRIKGGWRSPSTIFGVCYLHLASLTREHFN